MIISCDNSMNRDSQLVNRAVKLRLRLAWWMYGAEAVIFLGPIDSLIDLPVCHL